MPDRSGIRRLLRTLRSSGGDDRPTDPTATDLAARRARWREAHPSWPWPREGNRWTVLGPAGGPPAATVDVDGLVTPTGASWSVEMWIGASDGWHVPSRRSAPRQRLRDGLPVVETLVRIPSGQAVLRAAYAPGGVLVEVENDSPAPVALAVAVVPATPAGPGRLATAGVAGSKLLADGQPAVVFSRPPRESAVGNAATGHVIEVVAKERAESGDRTVSCSDGLAMVAAVVPLTHRLTTRLVVAAGDGEPAAALGVPMSALYDGWTRLARTGPRVELPDANLTALLATARTHLTVVDPDRPVHTLSLVAAALARWGRPADAEAVLREVWSRLHSDGSMVEPDGSVSSPAAALWALDGWRQLYPRSVTQPLLDALTTSFVPAAGYVDEHTARLDGRDPVARWADAGLRAAHRTMAALHHPDTDDVARAVARRVPDPSAAAAGAGGVSGAGGRGGVPSLPPLGHPAAAALARVAPGDAEAAARALAALQLSAGSTVTWPPAPAGSPGAAAPDRPAPAAEEVGAPDHGRRDGHDPRATAEVLLAVADWLVQWPEDGEPRPLTVLRAVPADWTGGPAEMLDLPVPGGRASLAVRWHGTRPALLWDVDAPAPLTLRAPGYAPDWSSQQNRGETLLPAPAAPDDRPRDNEDPSIA